MARLFFLLLAVLFSTVSLALAQTSTSLINNNPIPSYQHFKAVFASKSLSDRSWSTGEVIPLISCTHAGEYIGYKYPESNAIYKIAELAFATTYIKQELEAWGYPETLWQRSLGEFEQSMLADARRFHLPEDGNAFTKSLAAFLNEYRLRHGNRLPEVNPGVNGCGGGEIAIRLVAVPGSAHIQYINAIFYDLCRRQNIEPDDPSKCDHWSDYSDGPRNGLGAQMAGKYKVRVIWTDGFVVTRNLNVDDLHPNPDEAMSFVIRR
jgi:hypothetical protein